MPDNSVVQADKVLYGMTQLRSSQACFGSCCSGTGISRINGRSFLEEAIQKIS